MKLSLLDWLWDLFIKPNTIPIHDTQEITGDEVRTLLAPFGGQLWISDGMFRTVDTGNLQEFLVVNPVDQRKCENCKFTKAGLGCENPEQDSNPAFFLDYVDCYEPR